MADAERIAREAHDRQWPSSKFSAPDGTSATSIEAALLDAARCAFEAGRATGDLSRRALEACEKYAKEYDFVPFGAPGRLVCEIGRESLAAKKGPWTQSTVDTNEARHDDGRCVLFFSADGVRDRAACAEWVREQNEKAAR